MHSRQIESAAGAIVKKKGPSTQQIAMQRSNEELGARNAELGAANQTVGSVSPVVSRITSELPGGGTALRRSLTNTAQTATNNSYDNVMARTRERAAAAGFGYAQPVSQAADTGVGLERARRLSEIPGEVEQQATGLELQAGGLGNALANTQLSAAGQYQPESYFNTAANLENEAKKRKAALIGGLINAGTGIATAGMK